MKIKLTTKQLHVIIGVLRALIELFTDIIEEGRGNGTPDPKKKGGKYERENDKGHAEQ